MTHLRLFAQDVLYHPGVKCKAGKQELDSCLQNAEAGR